MSKKTELLEQTNKARSSLEKELVKIEMALGGAKVEQLTPRNKFECIFGRWFHGDGHLKELFGPQLYEKLEALHTEWHTQYGKIYTIYFQEKKGFFNKLLHKEPSEFEKDKAKAYLDDLQKITQEMLQTITVCQRRLNALSDAKF